MSKLNYFVIFISCILIDCRNQYNIRNYEDGITHGPFKRMFINRRNKSAKKMNESNVGRKIVGGVQVQIMSYPYFVSIQSIDRHMMCGGSLVNARWVITAAHCLLDWRYKDQPILDPELFLAVMGSDDVRKNRESHTTQIREAAVFLPHLQFNNLFMANDIGLVKVKGSFNLNNAVQIAKFPTYYIPLKANDVCRVIGWGNTISTVSFDIHYDYESYNLFLPESLMMVEIEIIDVPTCQYLYSSDYIHEGMNICAGTVLGGKDACKGDSGGPLICDNTVIGIVSWGQGCGDRQKPGVYTRVDFYLDWISESMETNKYRETQNNSEKCLPLYRLIYFLIFVHLCLCIQLWSNTDIWKRK